jgi:hypothetical protein
MVSTLQAVVFWATPPIFNDLSSFLSSLLSIPEALAPGSAHLLPLAFYSIDRMRKHLPSVWWYGTVFLEARFCSLQPRPCVVNSAFTGYRPWLKLNMLWFIC